MSTFVRGATAMTAVCVSVVTFLGTSATATADPSDNQANNDKLFALLPGGYTPANCQAGKQYPEDPFLARLGCGRNSQPGPMLPLTPFTEIAPTSIKPLTTTVLRSRAREPPIPGRPPGRVEW